MSEPDDATTEPANGATEPAETTEEILRDGPGAALARARAVARGKGLRPGRAPKRRPKDAPGRILADGRDPQLLGDQIDLFVAERGWRGEVAVGSVIGRWPGIVGPDISAHCQPVDFTDGILTIRAESTAWATQLRLLASTLHTRLTEEVGEGTVAEIRIVGPSAPSWSKGALRVSKGRGPRDTYG